MARQLPPQTLEWLHRVLLLEYQDINRTYSDAVQLLQSQPSLSPRTSVHTYETGKSELLLNFHGTLPCFFHSATYNIPVSIWVPHEYPHAAPFAFVTPTQTMAIRAGNHVDTNGRVYHPFISYWNPQTANLVAFCAVLSDVFGKEPPVYGKPQQQQLPPQPSMPPSLPQYQQQQFSAPPPQQMPENLLSFASSTPQPYQQRPPTFPPEPQPQPQQQQQYYQPQYQQPQQQQQQQQQQPQPPVYSQTQPSALADLASVPYTRDIIDESPPAPSTPAPVQSAHPPLPPHPEQTRLLTQIADALQRKADAAAPQMKKQTDQLKGTLDMLSRAETNLAREASELERIAEGCERNLKILSDRIGQAEARTAEAKKDGAQANLDVNSIVCAEAVVFNQIYELAADDLAIGDTIYVLGKALDRERIGLDEFLKHARTLAREQFLKRALVRKIAEDTGMARV
ncbi:UEV domain-containing protein [Myxozyma melibiosi]|uniref:UEV domain-containing protein n=1 Tax=Myxozyma melibiosi TaxID=54550 RepID=A0ABR1F3R7_9ASCO